MSLEKESPEFKALENALLGQVLPARADLEAAFSPEYPVHLEEGLTIIRNAFRLRGVTLLEEEEQEFLREYQERGAIFPVPDEFL